MNKSNSTLKDIFEFIGFLILLIIFLIHLFSSGSSSGEIFYDDSAEKKAQDDWAKEQLYEQEREARWREQEDEYNDYLEWVRDGRP